MIRKVASGIMLTLLLAGVLTLTFNIQLAEADLGSTSDEQPSVDYIDFNNGTTRVLIDYHNGTVIKGRMTYLPGKGSLQPLEISENRSLQVDIPLFEEGGQSGDEPAISQSMLSDEPSISTRTQDLLLGFTWIWDIVPTWSETWEIWWGCPYACVRVASATLEMGLNFEIGLRLPVQITLEYPNQMLANNDYTVNATLQTLDWLDYSELLLQIEAGAKLSANVVGLGGEWTIGLWFDGSKSFQTPLGPGAPIPFPTIGPFPLASLGIPLGGVSIGVNVVPRFYSNRIEATAHVGGNASIVGASSFTWNVSGQKIALEVRTGNISDMGSANISIQDLKYVIDQFIFDFNFVVDPYGLLNFIPEEWNPWEFTFFTWDASDVLPDLKLGIHPGYYPESVGVNVLVALEPERFLHDVAIINATATRQSIYEGELVQISVTAENRGNATETFTLITYYGNNTIGTRIVENLPPEFNVSLTFNWDTTDVPPCQWYTIKAEAIAVRDEVDIINNVIVDGSVKIKMIGDVDGDDKIDIWDIAAAALSFGSYPTHPRWNPIADVNQDGSVDIIDIATIATHFGETCP